MRGANIILESNITYVLETSPHAWSKLLVPVAKQNLRRNISTCVEQTASCQGLVNANGKHLHMRGANAEAPPVPETV